MRTTGLAVLACVAGLLAGCGSSTKTVLKTTPGTTTTVTNAGSTTPGSTTGSTTTASGGPVIGSTGTMGPPSSGSQYDLGNHTVLQHLTNQLGSNLASHHYTHLQGTCRAFSHTQAECEFTGVNPQGQQFDDIFTLTVNLSTGAFTISNVHPGHSMVGSTGSMGPPPSGSRFDLTNHTVLQHLTDKLGANLASHGYTHLRGACKAFSRTQAECAFKGLNPQGQRFGDLFTLTVNLSTGAFRISNVRPIS